MSPCSSSKSFDAFACREALTVDSRHAFPKKGLGKRAVAVPPCASGPMFFPLFFCDGRVEVTPFLIFIHFFIFCFFG